MSLTPEQQQAVEASGSVAVTAGAGTGKTHMLTARYLHHITEDSLSPLQIVAVTFTEKAAAELRARIRQQVFERFGEQSETSAKLEAAQISTLHALAARICWEHNEEAQVPPDFEILDETEGSIWKLERMDEQLAALQATMFEQVPYSLMEQFLERYFTDPLSMQEALKRPPEERNKILEEAVNQARHDLIANDVWQNSRNILIDIAGDENDKFEIHRKEIAQAIEQVETGTNAADALQVISTSKINVGSKKKWPEGQLEEGKEAVRQLRELVQTQEKNTLLHLDFGLPDERLEACLPILQQAAETVDTAIQTRKYKDRVLDYADLEIHALKALEKESIREYYSKRWKAFLIDEFQDTNPIQARLLEALTENARLTIVGDIKQSIYGFRRADVEVFRRFEKKILDGGGDSISLSQSFRTHNELVSQMNRVFEPLLVSAHQELHSTRETPHAGPHIQAVTIQAENGVKKERRQQAEAKWIANAIQEMLDRGIMIHDKASDQNRPIETRDIAILARTWDPLDCYTETLQASGLPAVLAAGGNLLDTREAKDGLALLQFLADPSDNLALAALLRSPFFAVSDVELYTFVEEIWKPEFERKKSKTKKHEARSSSIASWWSLLGHSQNEAIGEARIVLDKLFNMKDRLSPSELLQEANRQTAYTAVIGNLPMAERRLADWRGLAQWCRQMEAGPEHVFDFVRRVRKLKQHEVEIARPPMQSGNAISLMTVHAAKGLEWPVVILPDLSRRPPHQSDAVLFEPESGCAVKFPDADDDEPKPLLYTHLLNQAKQKTQAEAYRLLYVAFTRARDRLILTSVDESGGLMDLLSEGLRHAEIEVSQYPYCEEDGVPTVPPMPEIRPLPEIQLTKTMGRGLHTINATDLSDYNKCPYRFYLKVIQDHKGISIHKSKTKREDAARLGTLTHIALENDIKDMDTLQRFEPGVAVEVVEEALQLAQQFWQSELFSQFQGIETEKEVPFHLERFDGIAIQGIIDLLGLDFVLDYKTSQDLDADDYRYQIGVYAMAKEKPKAYIADLRSPELYCYQGEQLKDIEQSIASMIQSIRNEEFEAAPSREVCGVCPFQRKQICEYVVDFRGAKGHKGQKRL